MAKLIVGVNDLATVNPELANEWNYEKNVKLPQDCTSGSNLKVWWKCKDGHEWQASLHNRVKGQGCPYCSGRYPILGETDLATINTELVKEWNYEKNEKLPQDYTSNSGIKVWWKCKKGHEWQAVICDRNNGKDCPYCSGRLPIIGETDLATTHPELVKEWNYEKNDRTPQDYTSGSSKKVWWICKNGHEWQAVIASRNKGVGCPYCSGRYPILGETDLVTINTELVKEWNYEKNEKLPQDYNSSSGKKVWWKCKKGHEWQAVIASRNKGVGCPFCSNQKVLIGYNDLATVNPRLAKEWNYEKNDKLPQDYTYGSNLKVWWKCKEGHEWQATISHRINGTRCPYCISGHKCLKGFNDLVTCYPNIAKEWHPTKNGSKQPEHYSKGSQEKIVWLYHYDVPNDYPIEQLRGKHFDFEWIATIASRTQGNGCPYLDFCTSPKLWKGWNDLATRYPNIAKEWHPTKNKKSSMDYLSGSGEKVWWLCPKGHTYESTILNRKQGRSCPYCANKKVLLGFNDLSTINPDLACEWNYEKNGQLTPQNVIAGSTQKVWWHCKNGHDWYASIVNRTKGRGCPYCSGSKTERLTYKILKEWNISFKAEKKFESDLRVTYYPYDVWISRYSLLIELDGLQHFKEVEYFEQSKSFDVRIKTDNIKNQFAFEKRIPLLRIPYTYNPDTEEEKIRQILKEFIETRKIPQEIIEYYEQYEFSNYAELASDWNSDRHPNGP